jgi:hypothetical protein
MGRTSKFSFPYPGRRRPSTESKPTVKSAVPSGHSISKAHKVLGTVGDLNIDSHIRDDSSSWRSFLRRPPSSGMSVAVSESTQDDMSTTSSSVNWHGDPSGGLRTKASSTVLGRPYEDGDLTDTLSSRHNLHTQQSSSTLRSYYDRQNTPLTISQQTSASSVRDLALRKGSQPVAQYPRGPLSEVDTIGPETTYLDSPISETASQSSRKKKPARLDLTKLFPKPTKDGGPIVGPEIPTRSTSVMQQIPQLPPRPQIRQDDYDSRPSSRESRRSLSRSKTSPNPTKRHDNPQSPSSRRNLNNRLSDLIEDRESRPRQSTQPIPSSVHDEVEDPGWKRTSRLEHNRSNPRMRDGERHRNSESEEHIGWQDVRISIAPPSVETSVASNSSRHSRTSRHNSNKLISHADLRNKSVLSISSDEDSDEGNLAVNSSKAKQSAQKLANQSANQVSRSSRCVDDRVPEGSNQKFQVPQKLPQLQDGNYLTIPLPPLAGSRLSGPWDHTKPTKRQSSASNRKDTASQASRDASARLSTLSKELQNVSARSSRMMAVTKQEEALLEALRLKRLRMKETIIAEHETKRTPRPPEPQPSRKTIRDSNGTTRGEGRSESERVLLYLDTPASFARDIDTAEPSPDLSDFLSFGSDDDEESTPRTSWIMAKDRARADSVTSPESENRDSPKTPQSAARLSAVGGLEGLSQERSDERRKGVTFLEGVQRSSPDFLEEPEVVWGM